MTDNRDQQIEINVQDGILNISIGVDLLCHALEYGYNPFAGSNEGPIIKNNDGMVKDVMSALKYEDEDGTTLIHRMFDKAFIEAIENGSEWAEDEYL